MGKKGGDPFGSDICLDRAKNYLLSKPMVTTKRELKPAEVGRLVIRSQEICWKGQDAKDLMGESGVWLGECLLCFVSGPPEFHGNKLLSFKKLGCPADSWSWHCSRIEWWRSLAGTQTWPL